MLITALSKQEFDKLQIWVPDFLPDDDYSFSYSDHEQKQNEVFSYLEMKQLSNVFDLPNIAIKDLKRKCVYAYSHTENRVTSNMKMAGLQVSNLRTETR